MSEKTNKLSDEEVEQAIEHSKKIVNAKPTDSSGAIYPGRKPMIGFRSTSNSNKRKK